MEPVHSASNVVVLADVLNPSLFRENWLLQRKVFEQGEVTSYIFTPDVVQVACPRYTLLVVPAQLQVGLPQRDSDGVAVKDVVGKVFGAIPHTPLTAVGINFAWRVDLDSQQIARVTKALFANPASPLLADFAGPECAFGTYMSRSMGDEARLKVDFKPMKQHVSDGNSYLHLAFNFHVDLVRDSSTEAQQVVRIVERWTEFDALAERYSRALATAAGDVS